MLPLPDAVAADLPDLITRALAEDLGTGECTSSRWNELIVHDCQNGTPCTSSEHDCSGNGTCDRDKGELTKFAMRAT